jgi:hypothetical protein
MTFIQLLKRFLLFPETILNAIKGRRRQTVLDERESERLDRIRNPWKYLGK